MPFLSVGATLAGMAMLVGYLAALAGRAETGTATRRLVAAAGGADAAGDPLLNAVDLKERLRILRQRSEAALARFGNGKPPDALTQRLKWAGISLMPQAWRMLPWPTGALGAVAGTVVGVVAPHYLPVLVLGGAMVGAMLPNAILNQRLAARRMRIASEILTYTEYLAMAMMAGADFRSAVRQVQERFVGPVSDAFSAAVLSSGVGGRLDDGLREAQAVLRNRDADVIVDTLVKNLQLGAECAERMLAAVETVRRERAERVLEKAGRAAVYLLIPIVVFIVPVVFALIVFPMLHQAITVLH